MKQFNGHRLRASHWLEGRLGLAALPAHENASSVEVSMKL